MKNNSEREVAKKAQAMLQKALDNEISTTFKRNARKRPGDKDKKPLRDAKVKYRGKNGDEKYFFNQLYINIGKHAFYLNAGVDTLRRDHTVTRLEPREKTYIREHHNFKLQKTDFINKAIDKSGVVEYVSREISEIRGYEVLKYLVKRLEEAVENKGNNSRPKTNTGHRNKSHEW